MSNIYEQEFCPNCGEFPDECDCTQQQIDNAESAAEAHYMARWEASLEEYGEDQLPEWPDENYKGEIPHPIE